MLVYFFNKLTKNPNLFFFFGGGGGVGGGGSEHNEQMFKMALLPSTLQGIQIYKYAKLF